MASMQKISHQHYVLILAVIFAIWWVFLAINPSYRSDWALENVLVVIFVISTIINFKKIPWSKTSYTLIFIFLCLHEIGAHYTYEKVPYEAWTTHYLGISINEFFGLERNHFDRLIHFIYGLILYYPIRELIMHATKISGFWAYFLPLTFSMAGSMLFELIEWGAATFFGGDLGMAYLGTQGDIWDAHKDMALAMLGALLGISYLGFLHIIHKK